MVFLTKEIAFEVDQRGIDAPRSETAAAETLASPAPP
jgi:hypothetical protein